MSNMSKFSKEMFRDIINKNRSRFTDATIKSVCNGDCPRECPLAPLTDMDIFRCGCTTARMEIIPIAFEKKYSSNNCGNFLLYIKYNLLKRIIKI